MTLRIFFCVVFGILLKNIAHGDKCGIPKGGLLVQEVAPGRDLYTGLFWRDDSSSLLWVSKQHAKVYRWYPKNGTILEVHIKELAHEEFVGLIPIKGTNSSYLLFSGSHVRRIDIYHKDGKEMYNISDVLYKVDQNGYKIHRAHSDKNGRVFFVAKFKNEDPNKKDALYKIEKDKGMTLLKENDGFGDFTWSMDNKNMYIVTEKGSTLTRYSYNLRKGTIDNEKQQLSLGCFSNIDRFSSVECDEDGNWYLGLAEEVYSARKDNSEAIHTNLPAKCTTSLTFGGMSKDHLFVSTCKKSTCNVKYNAGIFAISGYNNTGFEDYQSDIL